tara:strand:+ start:2682 stop:2822 length:141 start_codon:yes stop_codon:yes gene_type:complete
MKITRRQLREIIRQSLSLLKETRPSEDAEGKAETVTEDESGEDEKE